MSGSDFTVGDLRRQLAIWPDDTKLTFGGGLTFYRVKQWDDDEVFIEWGEAQADLNPAFRKRNPHIMVAFINPSSVDWDENGMIGSVDVSIR
jgi:hypothetical protein